jgi:hypothetical protein
MARVELTLQEMLLLGAVLEDRAEQLGPTPEGDALELVLKLSVIRVKLLKACRDELEAERLITEAFE